MKYEKPPLSIEEQIDLLISRGMVIQDRARAARYLTHINYYRLRAYWMPFETATVNDEHRFKPGTKFEDALTLYVFDRKFRILVLEGIERVEVSFRARFANEVALRYGSHAYLDRNNFKSAEMHQGCITSLQEELSRSRETFIEHYLTKYTEPALPPIWAICEIMSFGQLSKWFQNLKHRKDRKALADIYQINEAVLGSFMHHLTHVRNLVAHHSRLWNRRMTFTMSIPRRPAEVVGWYNTNAERKIYNTLVMLGYLLTLMSPGTTWPARVRQLLDENSLVNPEFMGFPSNWQELPLWRMKT